VPKSNAQSKAVVPDVPQWLTALEMVEDDEDVSERIGERIMQAETLEEMLSDDSETIGLRGIVEHHILVRGATLRRSDNTDGLGAYAVIDVLDKTDGEVKVVTCGAAKVLRKLVKATNQKWLPFECVVTETPSKTNPTRTVLDLVAPETHF